MTLNPLLRRLLLASALAVVCATGVIVGQQKYGMPKTVIHVVTLKWTDESTPAQRQKALDGIKDMAATIPGMKNIWLKTIKVQGQTREGEKPYDAAFVMEFADEAALKAYADHPKHKAWEEIYVPIRAESRSHDIGN
jgi:Stress responsive A/B Barrel Domain